MRACSEHVFHDEPLRTSAKHALDRVHVSWNHALDLVLCLVHVFHDEPLRTSAKHALGFPLPNDQGRFAPHISGKLTSWWT